MVTKGQKNKENKKAEENNTKDDHEDEGRDNEEETKVIDNTGENTKEKADKQEANQEDDQEVEGTRKTYEIEMEDLSPASPVQEEEGDSDPEIRELESMYKNQYYKIILILIYLILKFQFLVPISSTLG